MRIEPKVKSSNLFFEKVMFHETFNIRGLKYLFGTVRANVAYKMFSIPIVYKRPKVSGTKTLNKCNWKQ